MIPRYSRPQMAAIWEPENYFRIQLDIEVYACEAQEKLGVIPAGTAKAVRERGAFEVERHRPRFAATTDPGQHAGEPDLAEHPDESRHDERVTLTVDRYDLWKPGRRAVLDLGSPVGVDNVDAYRLISESFRWS